MNKKLVMADYGYLNFKMISNSIISQIIFI